MVLSISNLLTFLLGRVPSPPQTVIPDQAESDQRRIPTTVRLEPQVKAFVERHSEAMGLSIQDFIGMTLRAVMIASENPKVSELDLMISRFFDLFQSFEITTADIPLLLPENILARADLEHRDRILNALDRSLVQHIASVFLVNPEWLKGVSSECIDRSQIGHWYKSPASFARSILVHRLKADVTRVSVLFVTGDETSLARLDEARTKGDAIPSLDITPVIVLDMVTNGVRFNTYHVWDTQRWNYEKCRIDLKVMMLLCQRARISVDGLALPNEKYRDFQLSRILPANAFKRPYRNWPIDDVVWNDRQNLEQIELDEVERLYVSSKMPIYEKAISQYFNVINIERVASVMELPKLRDN